MTCRDSLTCIHEPFGDAFYYGPERLSNRFEDDEEARVESGFSESTYRTVFDGIHRAGTEVRSAPPPFPERRGHHIDSASILSCIPHQNTGFPYARHVRRKALR